MKQIFLTLKKEWFDKIKSGQKNIEYREYKQHWHSRFKNLNCDGSEILIFRNGYKKDSPTIKARLIDISIIDSGIDTDLKIDKKVYALKFEILNQRSLS